MDTNILIDMRDVVKIYETPAGGFKALKGVDLRVAQGKTILMVTHDQDLARRAGRAVTVADGEIVTEENHARTTLAQSAA